MSARMLRLPKLSTLEARYVSALARFGGAFEVTLPPGAADGSEADTHWRVACAPQALMHAAPEPAEDACLRLHFQWGGCAYALVLPETAVNLWTQARFPGFDPHALPAQWQQTAAALLATTLHSALRTIDADVLPVAPSDVSQWPHCWDVSVQNRNLCLETRVSLYMGHDGLAFLTEHLAGLPAEPSSALRDIPILLRALIGRTDLSLAQLRSLCVGDVVLLDYAIDIHTDEHWLATDSGDAFCIRPCPQGGSVTQPWKHCMSLSISPSPGVHGADSSAARMSPERTAVPPYTAPSADTFDPRYDGPYDDPYGLAAQSSPDVQAARTDEVEADELAPELADLTPSGDAPPSGLAMCGMGSGYALLSEQGMPLDPRHIGVQLVFDVGEYRIPLCDLLVLKPGAVINLGQTFSTRTVRIRSAGRAIGEGELIDVDGCVGVQITRWCAEPS